MIYKYNETKAIPLHAFPEEAWDSISGGTKEKKLEKLSHQVAWLYAVERKRAAAVAHLPWYLTRGDNDVDRQDWPFKLDLNRLIRQYSLALDLYGANYMFKVQRGRAIEKLRWLHPSTITPEISTSGGLTAFTRRLGTVTDTYQVKNGRSDIIWTFLPDVVEEGPGTPPANVVEHAANTLRYMSQTTERFFERGAIDVWVLFDDQIKATPEDQQRRLFGWLRRTLLGGTSTQGSGMYALPKESRLEQINSSIDKWQLPDLSRQEAEAICIAHDTPLMLLKPEQGSDKAMMEHTRLMWVNETIIPLGEMLADTLNDQLFYDLGYELVVRGEELNINQEEEHIRSQAVVNLVNAGETLDNAYRILGYDLPADLEERDEPESEPEVMPLPPMGFNTDEQETRSALAEEEYSALKRWLKNRDSGADLDEFNANHLTYYDKLEAYSEVFNDGAVYDWRNYLQ